MHSAYPFILRVFALIFALMAFVGISYGLYGKRLYGADRGHRKGVSHIRQYKYADKDIKKLISSIVVLVDTREKQNGHITDYLTKNNIAYEPTTLNYADYSFYIPAAAAGEDIYFHRDIAIERKASLEELSGNLAQERERFEKEFLRAGNDSAKLYLMVEDMGGYSSIIGHKYNTQFAPAAFVSSLKAWEARFNCNIQFIDKQYSGYFIVSTFKYFAREWLR